MTGLRPIQSRLKVNSITSIVKDGQLRWLGHIQRMSENRSAKIIYEIRPMKKEYQERPGLDK